MTIANKNLPYPDFMMGGVIDPEAFDLNNAILISALNETINVINKLLDSTVDGDSGGDNISITPIAPFTSTKIQPFLEEVQARLRSVTAGTSGSEFIGSALITNVTGTTVRAQLVNLKAQLDVEKTRIDSLTTRMTTAETNIANRYTKAEIDVKTTSLQGQINTNVANINNRYTKAEVDAKDATLQTQVTNQNGLIVNAQNDILTHTHDDRYMTRAQLSPYLQGGDTVIKLEVFTIVTSNNGNGTFTYDNRFGVRRTGILGASGEQVFALEDGEYLVGMNHMKAIINDTLHRTVVSGGLIEPDGFHVSLVTPEGIGTEITIEYFQRIGVSGEHNIIYSATTPPPTDGETMWFKVVG